MVWTKSAIFLVAANAVAALAVIAYLVAPSPDRARQQGAGDRRTPSASGRPSGERAPLVEPGVVAVRPREPRQEPGASRVADPERLPENTIERVRETRRLIMRLILAGEIYKSRHGEYPPSLLDEEEGNAGIESLAAHLAVDGLLAKEVGERWRGNTDDDEFPEGFLVTGRPLDSQERFEILDAWGNPLIYFRADRYATSERYRIGGEDQVATPQISKATGAYHARDLVQIWSAGPDGKNENGKGDDVTSWRIRE